MALSCRKLLKRMLKDVQYEPQPEITLACCKCFLLLIPRPLVLLAMRAFFNI